MTELDDQREALRRLATHHLNAEVAIRVQRLARPALRLRGTSGASAGHSRLGGDPLLAAGTSWPRWGSRPLSFLALIDLAEVDAALLGLPLPKTGLLNFFYEARGQQAWGYDPKHAAGWRVIAADERHAVPANTPSAALDTPATPVVFEPRLTIPAWNEHVFADLADHDVDAVCDLYLDWEGQFVDDEPVHQLGGWPGLIQLPIWRECQLGYHGVPYADQRHDPRVESLEFGNPDWTLLLQLDSDTKLRWMWADGGRLYFAARQEDLAAENFGATWMVLQCS
ncbi:MAG TPA: YwqG family protein [Pseudonocardiaceae bacterium]|jgi:uncharacterized protein YwqG